MKSAKRGDTLIEVLFAFAILGTIIGFSFAGAMSGYKSALTAQNRTQATFVAQYQADGLKTYRDSLDWDGSGGLPSFLEGAGAPTPLPVMNNIIASNTNFCMRTSNFGGTIYWEVITTATDCSSNAKELAPNLDDPQVTIQLDNDQSSPPNPNLKVATIVVSWQPRNAAVREQVTNTILLTKEQ